MAMTMTDGDIRPDLAPLSIVIVARHCGEPGSGGSRRPLLMAQTLQAMGHQVTVVTPFACPSLRQVIQVPLNSRFYPEESTAPASSSDGLPNSPECHTKGSLASRILPLRLMAWLRLWKYFPDIDIDWAPRAAAAVKERSLRADWLLTTSPPESVHVIGPDLAARLGARWCAELRDSWTEDSHRDYVRGLRKWAERRLSARLLRAADVIITVNDWIASEARTRGGRRHFRSENVHVIGHFSDIYSGEPAQLAPGAYHLVHSGGFSLSDRKRDLEYVFSRLRAAAQTRDLNGHAPLHFHIAGCLTEAEMSLCTAETAFQITAHGAVDLDRSRALQAGADMLLLYAPTQTLALPGKYAEYALSGRPVLFIGPDHVRKMAGETAQFCTAQELGNNIFAQSSVDLTYDVRPATAALLNIFRND